MADALTREEVVRRLREGTPVERLQGIANVIGENVVGGYIEDYESPGEKLGSGIESFAQALFQRPVETATGMAEGVAQTVSDVATPSYDAQGRPVVTQHQAMKALELAGGAGATGAVAGGSRLADLGSFDPTVVRMAGGRSTRDSLPVERIPDYDRVVRNAKEAVKRVEGLQRQMSDPEADPFNIVEQKILAKQEAARVLANNSGGVSLVNRNTEALITPSMENRGKFRVSYIDRRSREPMGHTDHETMEEAIRDALDQGYLELGRFEPQNFANGGGVASLNGVARNMFR